MNMYVLYDKTQYRYLSSGSKKWVAHAKRLRMKPEMLLALYNQARGFVYLYKDRQAIADSVKHLTNKQERKNAELRRYIQALPKEWVVINYDTKQEYTCLEFFDLYKKGKL